MIVMGMRVQHDDRQSRQLGGDLPDVTNSHAGIKEHGLFVAYDQVTDGLFGLMRLIESENGRCNLEDLKPGIADRHSVQAFCIPAVEGRGTNRELAPVRRKLAPRQPRRGLTRCAPS